ncbi:DUF6314 family protein [Streptomyces luomodiensis]|uniref:DUF6314 family protein n=1 Tax=Streptomyces luomodiensis TaxID=3026192 RepID=A0ABY9URZ0_9ACTN|nr:DUF6314 family protein [Streptomyces sp. SCA4-21]WNE95308.1 DUF6314 family protein [Streptomyces sp. SCA4-21]
MSSSNLTVHAVPDALAYLAGGWSVRRELHDGRHTGSFTGRAEFRVEDGNDGWVHAEEGVMEWGGAVRDAGRTLLMLPLPDGTAEVSFSDGRPFHLLDLRRGHWTAVHQCAADRYEGTFTVLSPDEWHLRWAVHGPAKNQLLTSVYRRARC